MGSNTTSEHIISLVHQVMHSDCGTHTRVSFYKINRVLRRDVLKYHLKVRKPLHQRTERSVEEHSFAIEDINRPVGDLAMN